MNATRGPEDLWFWVVVTRGLPAPRVIVDLDSGPRQGALAAWGWETLVETWRAGVCWYDPDNDRTVETAWLPTSRIRRLDGETYFQVPRVELAHHLKTKWPTIPPLGPDTGLPWMGSATHLESMDD